MRKPHARGPVTRTGPAGVSDAPLLLGDGRQAPELLRMQQKMEPGREPGAGEDHPPTGVTTQAVCQVVEPLSTLMLVVIVPLRTAVGNPRPVLT